MMEHFGDVLAIPFFAWLSIYFHYIPNKTSEQNLLYFFSVGGFVADSFFTFLFIQKFRKRYLYVGIAIYFMLIAVTFQNFEMQKKKLLV
jgi:hypothetical protein